MKAKVKRGFTLVELMLVIGILTITFSIGYVAVNSLQTGLKQTEVDAIARQMYITAQENITKIVSSGNELELMSGDDVYFEKDSDNNCYPEQYYGNNLYYVKHIKGGSDSDTAKLLLPSDSFEDSSILEDTYIIEYDPTTGAVVGVFYTPGGTDSFFTNSCNDLRGTAGERKEYADKNGLEELIGYYGAGVNETSEVNIGSNTYASKDVVTKITVSNDLTLSAKFDITLSENAKKYDVTLVVTYSCLSKDGTVISAEERTVLDNNLGKNDSKRTYTKVLDALDKADGSYFEEVFPDFKPGADITISAVTYVGNYPAGISIPSNATVSAVVQKKVNSYYSYINEKDDGTYRATIANARHLRNLAKSSYVNGLDLTEAKLSQSINMSGVESLPINSSTLKTFEGNNYSISNLTIKAVDDSGNAINNLGLFGSIIDDATIKNLYLVDAKIDGTGTNVGTLIGYAGANVTIEKVGVYLTEEYSGYNEKPADHVKVSGQYAGGLVGLADGNLTINNSFAATVINSSLDAGGLVGKASDGLSINNSYASSYVSGAVVGGLAGEANNFEIDGSYAAGSVFNSNSSTVIAGLVYGNGTKANKTYTIFGLGETGTKYSTFKSCTNVSSVFYIDEYKNTTNANNTKAISTSELSASDCLTADNYLKNGSFELTNYESHPYNFYNGILDHYPYPTIENLEHYGDWYSNGTGGGDSNEDEDPTATHDCGFFYWEKLTGSDGTEWGFYIVWESDYKTAVDKLTYEHDDGKKVVEYGYGYIIKKGSAYNNNVVVWDDASVKTKKNGKNTVLDAQTYNTNKDGFNTALENIIGKGYNYQCYKTADSSLSNVSTSKDLYLKNAYEIKSIVSGKTYQYVATTHTTVSITPKGTGTTYSYSFCPFFAADIVAGTGAFSTNIVLYNNTYNCVNAKAHQIRSIDQLQYLNYNSDAKNCHTLVTYTNMNNYPFLNRFCYYDLAASQISKVINTDTSVYKQTHDIDATEYTNYTPIAGASTFFNNTSHISVAEAIASEIIDNAIVESNLYVFAWFGSEYDGGTYQVKNLSIESDAYTIGMFGTTVGARLNNIIMTSTNNSVIKKKAGSNTFISDYFMGGLVGLACDATGDSLLSFTDYLGLTTNLSATIYNCAIGGYTIKDQTNHPTTIRGGAAVGGLVGSTTVKVSHCTAVVDIVIDSTSNYGTTVVGGLCGSASGSDIDVTTLTTAKAWASIFDADEYVDKYASVSNSYTGGSITFTENAKKSGVFSKLDSAFKGYYVGGIVGSNKNTNVNNVLKFDNAWNHNITIFECYTYMTLPDYDKSDNIYSIGTIFATSVTPLYQNIAVASTLNNAMSFQNVIYNCYYYRNGVAYSYTGDYNFIECEGYNSVDKYWNAIKNNVVCFHFSEELGLGNGDKALTYNDMVSQRGTQITDITYNCTTANEIAEYKYNEGGDAYSYPFKTVITRGTKNIHVGSWPTATKVTVKPGVLSSSKKPIVLYIADGENITNFEGILNKKLNSGGYIDCNYNNFGFKDANGTSIINANGTFAVTGSPYITGSDASRTWTYAQDGVKNSVNYLTVSADWGYVITLHYNDGTGEKTINCEYHVDSDLKKPSALTYTETIARTPENSNIESYEFTGWYMDDATAVAAKVDKSIVASKISYDKNGHVDLYAGWIMKQSEILKQVDGFDKNTDGTYNTESRYVLVHVVNGKTYNSLALSSSTSTYTPKEDSEVLTAKETKHYHAISGKYWYSSWKYTYKTYNVKDLDKIAVTVKSSSSSNSYKYIDTTSSTPTIWTMTSDGALVSEGYYLSYYNPNVLNYGCATNGYSGYKVLKNFNYNSSKRITSTVGSDTYYVNFSVSNTFNINTLTSDEMMIFKYTSVTDQIYDY